MCNFVSDFELQKSRVYSKTIIRTTSEITHEKYASANRFYAASHEKGSLMALFTQNFPPFCK